MVSLDKFPTENIIQELKNRGYIRIFWHKDDIISACETFDFTYNDKDIDAIVKKIENSFDASQGVNWNVIGWHIYEYFNPISDDGL
jgi:hypothetical protein